jgi:hypothetical protein
MEQLNQRAGTAEHCLDSKLGRLLENTLRFAPWPLKKFERDSLIVEVLVSLNSFQLENYTVKEILTR